MPKTAQFSAKTACGKRRRRVKCAIGLHFFDPPYGVPYNKTDFYLLNAALFPIPLKKDPLQIMSWSGDFTNYFDQGNEWWGTALWSIYDPLMQRYVIIGASLTD